MSSSPTVSPGPSKLDSLDEVYCILLAVAAAVTNVTAIFFLAWPAFKEAKFQVVYPKWRKILHLVCNIVIGLAAVGLFVLSTGRGPVALAMPVQTGATLFINMVLQGVILKMKRYEKNMVTGTMVLVFAVACLKDVGPTAQDNQEPLQLLKASLAIAWNCALALLLVVAGVLIKSTDSGSFAELLCYGVLQSGSTVALASVGKLLQLATGSEQYIFAAIYFIGGAGNIFASAKAASDTDQSIYMPVMFCLQLTLNCLTGLFVWEDWRVLKAPIAYACVYMLILTGVYSCSSYDFIMTSALKAHMRKSKLSQGKATSSFGRAVQELLTVWWYTPHDRDSTHPALDKVLSKAIDTKRCTSEELVALISAMTYQHGSEPSAVLMTWMEKDWRFYQDYLNYDADMRTVMWDIYQRASGRQTGIEENLADKSLQQALASNPEKSTMQASLLKPPPAFIASNPPSNRGSLVTAPHSLSINGGAEPVFFPDKDDGSAYGMSERSTTAPDNCGGAYARLNS